MSTVVRWLVLAFVASLFLIPPRPLAAAPDANLAPGHAGASPPIPFVLPSGNKTADSDLAPGRVIVKMKDGRVLRSTQSTHGALAIEPLPALGAQVWHVPAGREREVAQRLAADPNVEYAEPDRLARLYAIPNDPYYAAYQWNMPRVGARRPGTSPPVAPP